MSYVIHEPGPKTSLLLVHAPYPGRLKFDGEPSSLLYAVTPAVLELAEAGRGAEVGLLDPGESSEAFYEQLSHVLEGPVRVVVVSASSAALGEVARIVALVRQVRGSSVLIFVGGPHEDDCEFKVAGAIPGVDLSLGGEAEHVLAFILREFLGQDVVPEQFCRGLPDRLVTASALGGRGELASCWWSEPQVRPFDLGPLDTRALPPRCRSARPVRFSVFPTSRTIPVMVSRGCAYGQCTFCAEGIAAPRATVLEEFGWIEDLLETNPGTALYFQDSIFPNTRAVTERLLPLLGEAGMPWGCQVYLPMLSRRAVQALGAYGCRYVYTGIESGSAQILAAVGKQGLTRALLLDRLQWISDAGMRLGLSVMFGAMGAGGECLETEETVGETLELCGEVVTRKLDVAGFYPNVETVLPGTRLARELSGRGVQLDWFNPPKNAEFGELEDGSIGFNFLSLAPAGQSSARSYLAAQVRTASQHLVGLGRVAW